MGLRIISYGGGVQSSALVVLAVQGKLGHVDAALYSNVGDDSEHPATNEYVRNVMKPWAAERGFDVLELNRTLKSGETQTLWQRMMDYEGDKLREPIPVFGEIGMPMSRSCTADHKIAVVGKWLKAHGANKDNKAEVMIGISTDELQRANNKKAMPYELPIYPLLDLGLDRNRCMSVISDAGLPVPPKSSCFFCPFHRPQVWAELRRDEPELFEKAAQLEDKLIERRDNRGKTRVYLTKYGKPIREAIGAAQEGLFTVDDGFNHGKCDEGYCWT